MNQFSKIIFFSIKTVWTTLLVSVLSGFSTHAQPPGQIIPDPEDPAWLSYSGGGSYFLCGPGDPEGFLYRGKRNADGSRSGDQVKLIDRLIKTGANGIYLMAVRSHGGDGNSSENPFVDSDPDNGFDEELLGQWESWFTRMDNNGITIFFFFYDDSSRIWGSKGSSDRGLTSNEVDFVETLVNRFEHHKHLIWVVAEEYEERFTPVEVKHYAAAIRAADDNNHVIAVHKLSGLSFDEFADDPNIDQFAIQYKRSTSIGNHDAMVTAWNNAQGKYNINFAEPINPYGTGQDARLKNWAIAMGGAYVMPIAWDIVTTPVDDSDLEDCKNLIDFMQFVDLSLMAPDDRLASGSTQFVLAKPGERYIVYSAVARGALGIKNMTAGKYDFRWLDIVAGKVVDQYNVAVSAGDQLWNLPNGFGGEVALYIRLAGSTSGTGPHLVR